MKKVFLLFGMLSAAWSAPAQDFYQKQRSKWLKTAEQSRPALVETVKKPLRLVSVVADPSAYQGWKTEPGAPVDSLFNQSFKKQSGVILDFGAHVTGFLTFRVEDLGRAVDAPLRFKFIFAEMPAELAVPFDPYQGGLSRAWLQDEIVTVSEVPATITIPRRVAFQYVKIELLGSSMYSDFRISGVQVKATTAVRSTPPPLAPATPALIRQIDAIGLNTLKE